MFFPHSVSHNWSVTMMKITDLCHNFKWKNLHNRWLTTYFFAPLYLYCWHWDCHFVAYLSSFFFFFFLHHSSRSVLDYRVNWLWRCWWWTKKVLTLKPNISNRSNAFTLMAFWKEQRRQLNDTTPLITMVATEKERMQNGLKEKMLEVKEMSSLFKNQTTSFSKEATTSGVESGISFLMLSLYQWKLTAWTHNLLLLKNQCHVRVNTVADKCKKKQK